MDENLKKVNANLANENLILVVLESYQKMYEAGSFDDMDKQNIIQALGTIVNAAVQTSRTYVKVLKTVIELHGKQWPPHELN